MEVGTALKDAGPPLKEVAAASIGVSYAPISILAAYIRISEEDISISQA
jgi:hypothetical protein